MCQLLLTISDNELTYISNTLQEAENLNNSLRSQLVEQQLSLKEKFVRGLMMGQLSQAEIQHGLLEFRFTQIKAPFVVSVLKYVNYDQLLETFSQESLPWIRDTVIQFFEKEFSDLEYHKILSLSTDRFAVITAVKQPAALPEQLKRLLLQIEGSLDVELFASVGSVVPTIAEIDQSFSAALYVFQHRIFGLHRSSVCTMEDIRVSAEPELFYPLETENAMIEQTMAGNKETVMNLMDSLLQNNFPNNLVSKEQVAQFSLMLTSTFQRIIAGLNRKPENIFPDGTIVFLELKFCSGREELRNKISKILDYIIQDINMQKESINKKIAHTMREFIEKNYTKDISLCDLSEQLNISQEHASRLFKKLIGDNFKNYLSHYRYCKAKEIMDHSPTIKPKDVAALVGCNNTDALTRIFMKYEGISAGEYLKKPK